METLTHWISAHGYSGIFALLMLGIVGLPVPDEMLLTFAGFLVFRKELRGEATLATAFLGSISGITVSYGIGYFGSDYVLKKYGKLLHLTPANRQRVHVWFEHLGRWALMLGYFVPGVRHCTAIVAGVSKLEYPIFALFAYAGALLWTTIFISLGYYLGNDWPFVSATLHRLHFATAAIVVAGMLVYLFWRRAR